MRGPPFLLPVDSALGAGAGVGVVVTAAAGDEGGR